MDIQFILAAVQMKEHEIINLYPYGSRVYGTNDEHSDWDYIIVANQTEKKREIKTSTINATVYSREQFLEEIENHEISVLECLCLNDEAVIIQNEDFPMKLNLQKLRSSISAKASNSFVKAKKKLTVEDDYDYHIAIKSLFHSLRIYMYGRQIAEFGAIKDYTCANHYLENIKEMNTANWDTLKAAFQPIYNQLASEFKKYAPK